VEAAILHLLLNAPSELIPGLVFSASRALRTTIAVQRHQGCTFLRRRIIVVVIAVRPKTWDLTFEVHLKEDRIALFVTIESVLAQK
jgi:hypothetical protein